MPKGFRVTPENVGKLHRLPNTKTGRPYGKVVAELRATRRPRALIEVKLSDSYQRSARFVFLNKLVKTGEIVKLKNGTGGRFGHGGIRDYRPPVFAWPKE